MALVTQGFEVLEIVVCAVSSSGSTSQSLPIVLASFSL